MSFGGFTTKANTRNFIRAFIIANCLATQFDILDVYDPLETNDTSAWQMVDGVRAARVEGNSCTCDMKDEFSELQQH